MLKRIPITLKDGSETAVYRHPQLDANGNPKYFVHYLELGLSEYENTEKTRKAGLRKYTGRLFGGGYVFQSYNPEESMRRIIEMLHS